ncbi:hypothetical protein GOBAR_DD06213 [Gossypium barbadense]|nr:hypothetical protein GOBAR_DD06213 [Gossypium barbadense]
MRVSFHKTTGDCLCRDMMLKERECVEFMSSGLAEFRAAVPQHTTKMGLERDLRVVPLLGVPTIKQLLSHGNPLTHHVHTNITLYGHIKGNKNKSVSTMAVYTFWEGEKGYPYLTEHGCKPLPPNIKQQLRAKSPPPDSTVSGLRPHCFEIVKEEAPSSSSGVVPAESRPFGSLRGVQWRINLGILPPSSSIDDLRRVTADFRRRYAGLRRQLLVDPHVPKDGATNSLDLVMDNPLSQNPVIMGPMSVSIS